jgi:hypothetical protein
MGTHTLTIDDLERWVLSSAHWRVVDISSEHALLDGSRHVYVHGRVDGARIRRPLGDRLRLRTAHPQLGDR